MNSTEKIGEYSTSDLALACAITLYYPCERVNPADRSRVFFVFRKSKKLDTLLSDYWAGKMRIEPSAYFNQLKALKTRIYNFH